MAPPSGPAPPGPGPGANVLRAEPSAASAYGGTDLLAFDEREQDIRGREMKGAFGRKFINNGLWFYSPNRNFQFHTGG